MHQLPCCHDAVANHSLVVNSEHFSALKEDISSKILLKICDDDSNDQRGPVIRKTKNHAVCFYNQIILCYTHAFLQNSKAVELNKNKTKHILTRTVCIILGIYCTDILNLEVVGTPNRMISGNPISVYCFWYIWTAFQMLAIYMRLSSTQMAPHYSVHLNTPFPHLHLAIRDHYVDAPSQLDTTLQRRLSLAGCIHKMIPGNDCQLITPEYIKIQWPIDGKSFIPNDFWNPSPKFHLTW